MACCVFFLWISPEILAFYAHLFSSHNLHCVFHYSFKFLCFLEYLLGYFLEIGCIKILFCLCAVLIFYALWIAALLIFFVRIHLTAVLNTTLFLELKGSNGIFGSIYGWFWFRNMTPAAPNTMFDRCILWKTDYCWSRMFNFQKSWDLILGGFLFLSFGPLADFSLFSYCFGF